MIIAKLMTGVLGIACCLALNVWQLSQQKHALCIVPCLLAALQTQTASLHVIPGVQKVCLMLEMQLALHKNTDHTQC